MGQQLREILTSLTSKFARITQICEQLSTAHIIEDHIEIGFILSRPFSVGGEKQYIIIQFKDTMLTIG